MSQLQIDLNALLKEAMVKELARRRGKGTVQRLREIEAELHDNYANPLNWTLGRVLQVVYINDEGTETAVGQFQEFLHKRTSARRLSSCALSPTHTEYLKGNPFPPDRPLPWPSETQAEREQIRSYVNRQVPRPPKLQTKNIDTKALLRSLRGF